MSQGQRKIRDDLRLELQRHFVHRAEFLADSHIRLVEVRFLREDNEHEGVIAIGAAVVGAVEWS